jgi:hypothetical protein
MQIARLAGLSSLLLLVIGFYVAISVEKAHDEASNTVVQVTIDRYSGTLLALSILLFACYLLLRRNTQNVKTNE